MSNKKLSGDIAFMLYDTYGFPLDLTQDILREHNLEVNLEEFENAMQEQKNRSKSSWSGSGDLKTSDIYFKLYEKFGATKFEGYDNINGQGRILAILKDGEEIQQAKKGDKINLITDCTVFYGESGGQVGDTGLAIKTTEENSITLPFCTMEITDTKKPINNFFLHICEVADGEFEVGDKLNLSVNKTRRDRIRANHSATHLLHKALKEELSENVNQKGSYVDDKKLRLDVTHMGAISRKSLENVENHINKIIIENTASQLRVMTIENAKNLGAEALFGEKYEENVRVMFLGRVKGKKKSHNVENKDEYDVNDVHNILSDTRNKDNEYYSLELCGGTHVERTGDIGLFKIVKEEGISSGVRRIEAITGLDAIDFLNAQAGVAQSSSQLLNINIEQLQGKVGALLEENKSLQKKIKSNSSVDAFKSFTEEKLNEINFAHNIFENEDINAIKPIVAKMQNEKYKENSVILAVSLANEKVSVVLAVSRNLSEKINAVNLLKQIIEILGGQGGGGQAWFAMGGGKNKESIPNAIDFLRGSIIKK